MQRLGKVVMFNEEPKIFSKCFATNKEISSFVIKDLVSPKGDPLFGFYKVKFEPSRTAFIEVWKFETFLEQKYILRDTEIKKNIEVPKEIQDRVGNKYWILEDNNVHFYDHPNLLSGDNVFATSHKQIFTIQEIIEPKHVSPYYVFYKIIFDDTKHEAFLWAYSFKAALKDKDIITENEEKKGIVEKERSEEKAKFKASAEEGLKEAKKKAIEKLFKEIGISKGSYLWLKYEMYDLPWLTQVKLIDADLPEESFLIKFIVETRGSEIEMHFFNLDEVKKSFYTSDPTKRVSKWGKRIIDAIREGTIFISMTKEQVIASWGEPGDINMSVGAGGKHEQWIYNQNDAYLYFKNDKLTSIRQRR